MKDMTSKVKKLRQNYPELAIEVDGGVGPQTISECWHELDSVGTAVVSALNPRQVVQKKFKFVI